MAGVGKLIKQAQKMQRQMEQIQASLAERTIEVSSGGGAVVIGINGLGEFKSLKIDPELLQEDASLVEETILGAVRDATAQAKQVNETEMKSVTAGMSMPGLF